MSDKDINVKSVFVEGESYIRWSDVTVILDSAVEVMPDGCCKKAVENVSSGLKEGMVNASPPFPDNFVYKNV